MDMRENIAMELESGIAAFETKNFAHATKLLSPIAEEGNPDAMYRMAIMLQNGLGCLANEDKAFTYMKKGLDETTDAKSTCTGKVLIMLHDFFDASHISLGVGSSGSR